MQNDSKINIPLDKYVDLSIIRESITQFPKVIIQLENIESRNLFQVINEEKLDGCVY